MDYGEIFGVNSHKYLIDLFIVCPSIKISYWMKIQFFSNFGASFHQLKGNVENIHFDNGIIKIHEDKGFLPLIAITPSFPSLDPPFLIFPNNLIPLQMAPMTPLHYLNPLVIFLHNRHPFLLHLLFNHHLVKGQYLSLVVNLKFANYLISIF